LEYQDVYTVTSTLNLFMKLKIIQAI